MGGPSGSASIHGDPDRTISRVLEPSRHRKRASKFSVNLTLRRPRTNGAPTNQIRGVLGRDGIEELASCGESQLGDVEEEGSCDSETFVNLERAVHVWIVDETFPADRRTGLLEVDAHDDVQVVFGLLSVFAEFVCVFERAFGAVD